ncbi:MAG: hypothetical protein KF773_03760 [Deltaproteobacteria bacterium]|nr:hypothetical protein [Deltaproteobacteria bacterium]MCW5808863.1 hypothetical protein [Deltaproteobacteria bacterium]
MWRVTMVVVVLAGCAAARVCPTESSLVHEDRPTGRVEWCRRDVAGAKALPAVERTYTGMLGLAQPPPASGGMHGPFTQWHTGGTIALHGRYADGVPDGVWASWYPDGARRSIGRYERGAPVGCFAVWDEHGAITTGVPAGANQFRVEACAPPVDGEVARVEARSRRGVEERGTGDATLHALAQGGRLGLRNETQRAVAPSAVATAELAVRKQIGRFRIGPALGLRLSDTDTSAYSGGIVAALGVPVRGRLEGELEVGLGAQYLSIAASRMDLPGFLGRTSLWSPLASARAGLSFEVARTFAIVGGARVEGAPSRDASNEVVYCAPACGPPLRETWSVGGLSYGLDVGVRVLIR